MKPTRLLVVDDEAAQRQMLAGFLAKKGYNVKEAESGEAAIKLYPSFFSPVALVDMKMPGMGGLELISSLKEINPFIQIIVLTAFGSVETAVAAMKRGAFHYQNKPVDLEELLFNIQKASEQHRLVLEHTVLNETVRDRFGAGEIIGNSEAIKKVLELINLAAPGDTTVLIYGASGTGKELAARAIHALSPRKDKRFVAVNCAAIPENLLESELFGYERGAFTGAEKRKPGRFELADGGTIFLDEIGDMPIAMQAKLLRAIEEKKIERLGGQESFAVDVRILAATNKDLKSLIKEGRFRDDLYFRLNVITINMPALADRQGDILLLAEKFLRDFSRKLGRQISGFSPEAARTLVSYSWPGNVRELQNVIERAVVLSRDNIITLKEIPGLGEESSAPVSEARTLMDVEKYHIKKILDNNGWNIGKSADILGIHRNTLRMKIREYNLSENQ
jgi:two-component system response regulator HydG